MIRARNVARRLRIFHVHVKRIVDLRILRWQNADAQIDCGSPNKTSA